MPPRQKWLKGLAPDTPLHAAAKVILRERFKAVAEARAALTRVGSGRAGGGQQRPTAVHALRVSTRRGDAALRALAPVLPRKKAKQLRRRLKDLRSAASAVRDADVQRALIDALPVPDQPSQRAAHDFFVRTLASARIDAAQSLREALGKFDPAQLKAAQAEVLKRLRVRGSAPATMGQAATEAINAAAARVSARIAGPIETVHGLHELRLSLKALRYVAEVFGSCAGAEFRREVFPRLVEAQNALGDVNDTFVLADALGAAADHAPRAARSALRAAAKAARISAAALHADRLAEWRSGGTCHDLPAAVVDAFAHFARLPSSGSEPPPRVEHDVLAAPAALPPAIVELKPADHARLAPTLNGFAGRARKAVPERAPRIAAIDVGTNSIRLIVAEASDDGAYRILDDEREISRLGRGLHQTGRMDVGIMRRSAKTIARMKGIAEGYGATALRVVGTCAAREAENGAEFLRMVRDEAGVELEVISGAQEALLAYKSAAAAFDLRRLPAAVADIGGGSTEVVFSVAAEAVEETPEHAGAGVVERVVTTELGAVRLTEMFGGAEACAGPRFEEMRRHIRRELKRCAGRPPTMPQVLIGTGGTFTTLGAMAAMHAAGRAGGGRFSGPVQGIEVRRAEVMHLLDRLRELPVKERVQVPGLGSDRADIIVAGLAVVDAMLRRFKVNRVRIHEGGIRDGLLLTMVERLGTARRRDGAVSSDRRDPLRSVRRFAVACGYEQAHSTHVAALALSLFDQLVTLGVTTADGRTLAPRDRVLLEAAAILHDIGYLINYKRHHKHSYHLIVHADLPGFSGQEVQVVANAARYHRGALPKEKHENLAVLAPEDRARVAMIAAILRVADGLDRTHTQHVETVVLHAHASGLELNASAHERPTVDLWGSEKKSDLFRAVFARKLRFAWRSIPPAAGGAPVPVAARVAEIDQLSEM